mgnify:CR=1 FL=1
MPDYIFVYGTLRRGIESPMAVVFGRYCEYISDAYMMGRLYQVGAYPGAIETDNPAEKIYGEVYRVSNSDLLMPLLDGYEGCSNEEVRPHEYLRKKLCIQCLTGEELYAWVYLYNHDVSSLSLIASGDYRAYIETDQR